MWPEPTAAVAATTRCSRIDGVSYYRTLPDGAWARMPDPPQLPQNHVVPWQLSARTTDPSALRTLLEGADDVTRTVAADGTETYAATVDQDALEALRERPPISFPGESDVPMRVRLTVGANGLLRQLRTQAGDAQTTVDYPGLGMPQDVPGAP